jgi:hypothetical protein
MPGNPEDLRMTSESPLHRALAAWRQAEHRLQEASPGDPERAALADEVERRRVQYQALFDEVEDVAGHGAPYVNDDAPRRREGDLTRR